MRSISSGVAIWAWMMRKGRRLACSSGVMPSFSPCCRQYSTASRVTSSALSPMQWVAGCKPWRYALYILLARSSGLMTRMPVLPGSSA